VQDSLTETPVAAAVRAASGRIAVLVGPATGPGWVSHADLVRPERMGDLVRCAAAWCGGCPTVAARAAAGTLLMGDLAAAFAGPIGAMLVAQRRALRLDPAGVRLRIGADGVEALAVCAPVLGVLPGDPLAGCPGVSVLAGLPALRRVAAEGYAEVLAPLLEPVCTAARRGLHVLWAEAADRLAGAVFLSLRELGRAAGAPGEVADLLAVAPAPLRRPVEWLDVPGAEGSVPWKRRSVCCLAYRTPRWAGECCATCPLTPPEETVRRIGEHLRAQR
jgi:hypothetical protein